MRSLKLIVGIIAFSLISTNAISAVPSFTSPFSKTEAIPSLSKKQQQKQFMKWFVKLSPKEYGKIRGKKLNIFEKASFKMTQYRMKQQLGAKNAGDSEGANWGGLALGFFLGLLGVLGAYIFSKDKNFIKWTWIGCGIWVVLSLILFI